MLRKGIYTKIVALLLIVIVIIIAVTAYYLIGVNEKQSPDRLGILPDIEWSITETTTTPIECSIDEDCPIQTKCEEKLYYNRNASCGNDGTCFYGNWTFSSCTESVNYCGARCDDLEDCPRSRRCQPNCICAPI